MKSLRLMSLVLIALIILAACSPEQPAASSPVAADNSETEMADSTPGDDMMDEELMAEEMPEDEAKAEQETTMDNHDTMTEEMAQEDDMAEEGMASAESADHEDMMVEDDDMAAPDHRPAWQTLSLTDVRDGSAFTLADFAGKTIYVEPMATWCTNCRMQLLNVQQARAHLNSDDIVFVGISVETNIADEALAQYAQGLGFDWAFAVASPEILQEMVSQFGRAIVNPPSTPHFIIQPDGSFGELITGIDSADEVVARLQG